METPTEIIMAEVKLLEAKEKKIKSKTYTGGYLTEEEVKDLAKLEAIKHQKRILLAVARKLNKK